MILVWILYIVGIAVFSYPFIAKKYHERVQVNVAKGYQQEVEKQDKQKLTKIKQAQKEHNKQLSDDQANIDDQNFGVEAERQMQEEGISNVTREELGEVVAVLEIPKIRLTLPVYYGTNSQQISNGAGVMKETSLPFGGADTHSVITSHRGLPTAKLFTDLPQLQQGDQFFINVANEVHAYQVDQIKTIDPEDYSDLQIIPGEDYVTLLTCTPYMINSHRLLVRGKRVTPYRPESRQAEIKKGQRRQLKKIIIGSLLALLSVVIMLLIRRFYNQQKLGRGRSSRKKSRVKKLHKKRRH